MVPSRLALLAALVALLSFPAMANDLATLRARVVAYYSALEGDPDHATMRRALDALEDDARRVTAEGFWLGDGSWSDIDYGEVPSGAWSPWEHFRRLRVMAKAYATPGQQLHRDGELLLKIESSLTFLDTFYARTGKTPGNWWFWSIGPALDLGPVLVLVAEDVQPSVRESATRVLERRIGSRPGVSNEGVTLTGQNRIWSATNHMMLAILRDDTDRMTQVRSVVTLEIVPSPVGFAGLKADGSFHQHGPQYYTGGYGASFAYEVSKYFLLTRGTPWAPSQLIDRHVFNYLVDGIAWSLYQNYFDISAVGREAAYPTASGFNGIAALLHGALVPSERQAEIRAAAAMMLGTWDAPLRTELAAIASVLGEVEASWPSGMRVYPDSDHVIHRRPGWFASVSMFSSRTISGETVNDENLVGSRQSDGRVNLVIDGDEYFGGTVRPTLDWSRLPGITVEQHPGAASAVFGRGSRAFVGGVTNGRTGVAAMDLSALGSQLSAKKAWIFLDDSIVFLTSDVVCLTGNRAETIVDQRPVRSGEPLSVGGVPFEGRAMTESVGWAAAEGVGYFFPAASYVSVLDETRHGSWVALARKNPQGAHSNRIRTIWIDHGSSVANGSAEYVIVPGVDAAAMEAWAEAAPVTVLRNDGIVAAARDERTGELGIVFWLAGEAAGVSVDRPAIVHLTDEGATVTLSVADPARAGTRVRVTLPESLRLVSGNATAKVRTRTTTIDVTVSGGRTSTVVLSRNFRARGITR